MTRYYPGTKVPFNVEVTTTNGDLVDAPDITFVWKIGLYGEEHTETPIHTGTGTYAVTIIPDRSGQLYAHWDTNTGLDVAAEPKAMIRRSAFTNVDAVNSQGLYDYGFPHP
jgi:hypothetical protein